MICPVCKTEINSLRHDHQPNQSGLDDGPWLPGRGPRKKPSPKTAEEMRAIRLKAWATRRSKTRSTR